MMVGILVAMMIVVTGCSKVKEIETNAATAMKTSEEAIAVSREAAATSKEATQVSKEALQMASTAISAASRQNVYSTILTVLCMAMCAAFYYQTVHKSKKATASGPELDDPDEAEAAPDKK